MTDFNLNYTTPNEKIDKNKLQEIAKSELGRLINTHFLEELKKEYKIRAVLYLRVSTEAQAKEEKVSLDEQRIELEKYARERKWEVINCYREEGKSGKDFENRPELNRMIDDAKAGEFDVIVVWRIDRLGRNTEELQITRKELKALGVQICSVSEPTSIVDPRLMVKNQAESGTNKLIDYLRDWIAEEDNRARTARFNMGKMGKARKGLIPVKPPYGYKKIIEHQSKGKSTERDIINPEEAKIVKMIFDLYDQKYWGIHRIVNELNQQVIPSPKGGKWGFSTVKYILLNPTYAGLVRYGWRLSDSKDSRTRLQLGHEGLITKGLFEPIVTLEQFNNVKKRLINNRTISGRAANSKGLLTGVIKCGRCGGGAYFTSYHNWHTYRKAKEHRGGHKKSEAYFCSNYTQYGRKGCSARYVLSAPKAERILVAKLAKLASSKESLDSFVKEVKRSETKAIRLKINNLVASLEEYKKKQGRIKKMYIDGRVEDNYFEKEDREIQNGITETEERLYELRADLADEEKRVSQTKQSIEALLNFEKIWPTLDFEEKRELLRSVVDRFEVDGNKVRVTFVSFGSKSTG